MKKNVLKIMILTILCIIGCSSNSFSNATLLGDINEDEKVTNYDVSLLKRYLIDRQELNEKQKIRADINQDGEITLTDYSLLKSILLGFIEQPMLQGTIYDVELEKFNIKNDESTWENNANGITEAIRYAKENHYKEVRFPTGIYKIQAPKPIIIDTKDLIINFNNATIKMQDEPYTSHWCMIDLREPAENLVIKNGMIQGNRFSEKFNANNPYNEGTIPFSIKGGNGITIENLVIKDSSGYGMTIDTGMTRSKRIEIWANDFESGSISNTGELEENTETLRSKKMYPVGNLGGEFEIGYTAGYQGYGSILHQEYKAYFFDENKQFISMSYEKQYVKSSLPENCKYLKIVISQKQIKNGSEGSAFITNAKTFRNSVIKNCTFDANSAVGFAIGGGQNFTVENCNFTRNGINIGDRPAISAKVAVDLEDGWECMQNITFRKNKFSENRYDFTSCAGSNLIVEENEFTNGCSIYPRSTNYIIKKNNFKGAVNFGVSMGGEISNNTYTDSSVHTYYSRFGNDKQTPLLNIHNENFVNTSVYAQNIDTKKENQLVKDSTFTTSDGKKVWLKGNYENCTFTQATIFNSAFLKNCTIKNTNMHAQELSKYENCVFEVGNIITNSAEEIRIFQSRLINVPIEITTWAKPCKLIILDSELKNTDTKKEILRISAGKAKEVQLIGNTLASVNKVIEIFDTTYTAPEGKILLQENKISIPEESYVINGKKIASGNYVIECRKNLLPVGGLLHPNYQNSDNLTIIVEAPTNIVAKIEEKNSYSPEKKKFNTNDGGQQEKKVSSFDAIVELSKQEIKEKEEFYVFLKIKNYQNIEKGLLALSGQLEYDKSLLDLVEIEGCNGWIFDENSFNETNLKFLIDSNSYQLGEETILKIKMKAKEGIFASKETRIKLKNMIGSNAIMDIASQEDSANIKIVKNEENENLPDNTTENITTENITTENITTENREDDINNIDTTAKIPLPKAGFQNYIFIFLIIAILGCIACYLRMKNIKE